MSLLLSIQNTALAFGHLPEQRQVVYDFNLTIARGMRYAIVGESGSGKSVTMLSLCGLVPGVKLLAGSAMWHSQNDTTDLYQLDDDALSAWRGKKISYIFQEPMTALNPLMTCGKQVAEVIAGKNKDTVLQWFEKVKLPEPERIYRSYPHQISGGQRQRVMIAMALAGQPEMIIADEPTTALDASVQRSILDLLDDICRQQNTALVLISHDLNLVKRYSDHITVMYRGKIMEQQSTEKLFAQPQSDYTRALLSIKPSWQARGQYLHTLDDYGKKTTPWPQSSQSDETLLQSGNLVKWFGKKPRQTVLKHISFEVKKGETLGIVGESGCGKSTLARILVKLYTPDGGHVILEGQSIHDLGKKYSRKVQMIFQDPYSSLNPVYTALKTLTEPMQVHGIGKNAEERYEKAAALMTEVGLSAADLEKYPHEFSGGQRQRLCIARALSIEPELIICDESVSALDVSVQAQILNLLKRLQFQKHLTYMFISHDLNVVAYVSDRVMVMDKGEIAELGETGQVITHPQHAYTQKLISLME